MRKREEVPSQFIQQRSVIADRGEFNSSVMRALHAASPDGILVVNDEGLVVSLNRKFLELWKLEEVFRQVEGAEEAVRDEPLLNAVVDRVVNAEEFLRRVRHLYAHPELDDQCELALKDGTTLERYSTVICAENGSYLGRVWFFRDITRRRRLEAELRNSEQRFRVAAEAAQDAFIVVDSHGGVRYWNPAAERILGYSAQEILGQPVHEMIAPESYREQASDGLKKFGATGKGLALGIMREYLVERKDGRKIPVELSVSPMNYNGEWWALGIMRDISKRKKAEERVAWLARNDALTGLPNRTVFMDAVRDAIAHSARGAGSLAVFYVDLDHFKDINDTLGHPAGDLLLQEVASRLRRALRSIDKVARLGGDEFAILAAQTDAEGAAALASKILAGMNCPFFLGDNRIRTGMSIGIAVHDKEVIDPETLLGRADMALYRSKAEGRNTFRFFTDTMQSEMRQRVSLLGDLEQAIAREQLYLVYQPEVALDTGEIIALEALVRWRHPERGTIMPSEFIPLAENSGLMVPLGRWVMREACRQARRWLDMGIDVPVMAVNVSPMQLKGSDDLSIEIAEILHETGVRPNRLEIELTETTLIEAWQHNGDLLRRLQQQGIRIAIDDFGTGYSSLEYLRRFPGCRIKIAQTFVAALPRDAGSSAIIRAAIGLARELGREVIAEGVETGEQVKLLQFWGCKEGQGYHFAKPLCADDVVTLLPHSCQVQGELVAPPESKMEVV